MPWRATNQATELALSELLCTFPAEQAAEFLDVCDDLTGNGGLTLLVPANKAVMILTRKPHQSPPWEDGQDIEVPEEEYDRQSKENVQRWVEAHIIPVFPCPTLHLRLIVLRPEEDDARTSSFRIEKNNAELIPEYESSPPYVTLPGIEWYIVSQRRLNPTKSDSSVNASSHSRHQTPPSSNGQNIKVSEEEYDRRSKEDVQKWVEAYIVLHAVPLNLRLYQTSPRNFPSNSNSHKTTMYDTLLQGKLVSFAFEKSEVEI
ncbi:hypothetical protein GYMLUDRAFT_248255 [Collybiopsis luxurians FD-317 M1]|uniref:FAS1 domain-containing protein n=1 Tax=Collybiopsis luxurians FD-317 M1 TaxID=944289 RepID=A0A0D0BMG0_9AGAR|nr:hypothetical protein GYMLUDRAFT_248255 [Collybiopsis luxurians FD-317 M1]